MTRQSAVPSPGGQVLEVQDITLSTGKATIVKDVSFSVRRGSITLLAGPNGAGKSTLLSIICGLIEPTAGKASISGQSYTKIADPVFTVGSFLSAEWLDASRTARDNLKILAQSAGVADSRVEEVIDLCGLSGAANRTVKGFSLGMRQRCGIAAALLGEPEFLILDEPANGLDPLGMAWMRDLLVNHRDNGGTVLLSSHLLRDAEDMCDDLVVLAHGEVQWAGPLSDFGSGVEVATEFSADNTDAILTALGVEAQALPDGLVQVPVDARAVSAAARSCGVDLTHLVSKRGSLEETFQQLVSGKEDIR